MEEGQKKMKEKHFFVCCFINFFCSGAGLKGFSRPPDFFYSFLSNRARHTKHVFEHHQSQTFPCLAGWPPRCRQTQMGPRVPRELDLNRLIH